MLALVLLLVLVLVQGCCCEAGWDGVLLEAVGMGSD